jgi:MarR family transcriptional regulator, organic hydroperoxide resistance regulator
MDQPITYTLIQVCRAHRKAIESRLNAIGLYAGQEAILLCLLESNGLSQSDLTNRMGVDLSTMTKAVTRLERAGFVERRTDPDDGRVSRVYITTTGQRLESDIRQIWREIEDKLTEGLSDTERMILQRLLPHLLQNLS